MNRTASATTRRQARGLVAICLAGARAAWPARALPGLAQAVIATGAAHGALPLLHERALPNARYVLERYATRRRALYLHRALTGAFRLLRPAP